MRRVLVNLCRMTELSKREGSNFNTMGGESLRIGELNQAPFCCNIRIYPYEYFHLLTVVFKVIP